MKTWISSVAGVHIFLCFLFQGVAGPPTFLTPREPEVSERGPHHRIWKTVVPKLTSYGKTYYQTNEVIELQTGLHRLTPEGWIETTPRIRVNGKRRLRTGATPHANVHTRIYYENVLKELKAARRLGGKPTVEMQLEDIGGRLKLGIFPYSVK
jgi:hypothetical protein